MHSFRRRFLKITFLIFQLYIFQEKIGLSHDIYINYKGLILEGLLFHSIKNIRWSTEEKGLNYPLEIGIDKSAFLQTSPPLSFFFFADKRVDVWRSIQLQLGRDSIAISTRERGGNRDIPLSPGLAQWPQARTSFALRYLERREGEIPHEFLPFQPSISRFRRVGKPRWRCMDKIHFPM